MDKVTSEQLDTQFKFDVAAHAGGENIKLCFACGTCTAGCPVAEVDDDFDPRQIIRKVLLGMRKDVLSSPTIWKCVQCYSCTAKCPQNVKFREVIRALRQMAVAEGYAQADMIEEMDKLGQFAQGIRRDMVGKLLSDPKEYQKIKDRVSRATGSN